jgi:hypothetical protein
MALTHYKKLMNPNYLGSWDVPEGKEMPITIIRVDKELVTGPGGEKEECVVAKLKDQKPMILNATNCKAIKKVFDSPYIEDWQNKTVIVRVEKVKAFGEMWDALRIVTKKIDQREVLSPSSPRWAGAIEALINGKCDIAYIKKNFRISAKDIKELEASCSAS